MLAVLPVRNQNYSNFDSPETGQFLIFSYLLRMNTNQLAELRVKNIFPFIRVYNAGLLPPAADSNAFRNQSGLPVLERCIAALPGF
jgi:hypothetical protein